MIDYKELYSVCGAKPSLKDDRDYNLNKIIPKSVKPPRQFRINVDKDSILNQGNVGCCVACSLALTRHLKEKEQSNDSELFSPMYIYGNREKEDCQDEGMFPREALRTLKNFGVCHKSDFDGYEEYPKTKKAYYNNKTKLDQLAFPNRISSYYRLNTNYDIMTALVELGAVTICVAVYECLYYPTVDNVVNYNKDTCGDIYGYHEMTITGYDMDKDIWIVANSWGSDYGEFGSVYIPMDYPIEEAWATVDEITEKKFISELPRS